MHRMSIDTHTHTQFAVDLRQYLMYEDESPTLEDENIAETCMTGSACDARLLRVGSRAAGGEVLQCPAMPLGYLRRGLAGLSCTFPHP